MVHLQPNDIVTHDIPLRPDLLVRLLLPAVLTEADAERLCGVIRALAMPGTTAEAKPE